MAVFGRVEIANNWVLLELSILVLTNLRWGTAERAAVVLLGGCWGQKGAGNANDWISESPIAVGCSSGCCC